MTANTRKTNPEPDALSVALVSIGIGRVRRGYERYFSDLHDVLRPRLDNVTLYVGALDEASDRQDSGWRIPGSLTLTSKIAKLVPIRRVAGGSEYRGYERECLAYALALLPILMRGEHDVVHIIDHPVAKVLGRVKRIIRFRSALLYSNACAAPARWCPPADHTQHIAGPFYDQAIADGVPKNKLSLAPCGIRTARFHPPAPKAELRAKHGVAPDQTVLLAVSAVKRTHKRVDYLIEEAARLDREDLVLWIDGSPEDPSLIQLARERLGDRCRITHVPSEQIPELLGLADVFVHGALEEAFGLGIVEAMAAGLPVIVHDSPHFHWLVGTEGRYADMSTTGSLAEAVRQVIGGERPSPTDLMEHAATRFDWDTVVGTYIDMYRRVAGLSPEQAG